MSIHSPAQSTSLRRLASLLMVSVKLSSLSFMRMSSSYASSDTDMVFEVNVDLHMDIHM